MAGTEADKEQVRQQMEKSATQAEAKLSCITLLSNQKSKPTIECSCPEIINAIHHIALTKDNPLESWLRNFRTFSDASKLSKDKGVWIAHHQSVAVRKNACLTTRHWRNAVALTNMHKHRAFLLAHIHAAKKAYWLFWRTPKQGKAEEYACRWKKHTRKVIEQPCENESSHEQTLMQPRERVRGG